tara:strand:- start:722 stop:892 length:171 start_codon:yes stop_codon:yes gene_type:complete
MNVEKIFELEEESKGPWHWSESTQIELNENGTNQNYVRKIFERISCESSFKYMYGY